MEEEVVVEEGTTAVFKVKQRPRHHSSITLCRPRSDEVTRDHGDPVQPAEEPDVEEEEEEDEGDAANILSELDDLSWLKRRKKRAMPRNIFEEIKYLEVMIVSDHSMYKRYKNKQHTKNFAKSVVNLVDAIFKEHLHTRVVLVAV
ncbi:hypothetical protein CRUP_031214, partial [Coryphaenoides rupestris]